MLLAGISAMAWWYAARRGEGRKSQFHRKLIRWVAWQATPSQKATVKYFWVVSALILLQMLLGVVTAHYGVEGDAFYGIPLSKWLPYSVTRTWHIQLGLFWIATAWLAAGLFIGPLVSEQEPKGQRFGVNVLFLALLVVVVGSLTGEWLSIHNKMTDDVSFYFGHQGYEYVDLGRAWQIALFVGLLLWLFLMIRVLRPASAKTGRAEAAGVPVGCCHRCHRPVLRCGTDVGPAYALCRWSNTGGGGSFICGSKGFFEVFATTVIAFYLHAIESDSTGNRCGGGPVVGHDLSVGRHHRHMPSSVLFRDADRRLGLGIGLQCLGSRAAWCSSASMRWKIFARSKNRPWVRRYKWPIYFFVAVAFWNMVGAGLFGFMINPPIALYYMQGLNTTPLHGHAALFGVYGMLGIGLMLVCLRVLIPGVEWKDGLLRFSFWSLNGGLMAMCVLSLLPVGLMQTWASVEHGYWYARSGEFLQTPLMQNLRWMRVPGDTIFALGAVALVIFVAGLKFGYSFRRSD